MIHWDIVVVIYITVKLHGVQSFDEFAFTEVVWRHCHTASVFTEKHGKYTM